MPRHLPRAFRASTRYAAMRAQRDEVQRKLAGLEALIAQARPVSITVVESVNPAAVATEIARLQTTTGKA